MDTSTLRVRKRGRHLSILPISSSRANRTLFSLNLSERLLTSSHLAEGAFMSERRSRTARGAGRSPMLEYRTRSAIGLRDLWTRSTGGSLSGRKVCVWSMNTNREDHWCGAFFYGWGHGRRCGLGLRYEEAQLKGRNDTVWE